MHGDELESLLRGYISGLEEAVFRNGGGLTRSPGSLIDEVGRWTLSGGQEDGNSGLVRRLAGGVMAQSSDLGATGPYGSPLPGSIPAALPAVSGEARMVGSLVDGDGASGRLRSVLGGQLASAGISALLDMFKGSKASDAWDAYQPNRYMWELPSHASEGLTSATSRISTIDSRYDGAPRPIESKEMSGNRIDVRIEALDARSFLDRKEEIAEAVRQAMLTSGVLGSPLNEY